MKAFFIVGVQRSGTTLLSVMLSKHPEIYMENRSVAFRIISAFRSCYDILPHNLKINKADFLSWIIRNDYKGRLADLLDYENIERYSSVKELIRTSIEKRVLDHDKIIWGDKAPFLQNYMSDILMLIPEAKIIHIVRDGRANAYSMSERSYQSLSMSAQHWVDGNIDGLVNRDLMGPENYQMIKYEDLLREPEKTLSTLCDFLDISFSSEMLDLRDRQEAEEKKYVKSKIDLSKIDQFKNQLSPRALKKVERIQGPLLEEFGYPLLTSTTAGPYRPVSPMRRLLLNFKDNFRQLFRRKRMGMIDRRNVEVRLPFKNRAYTLVKGLAQDLLSERIFKSLFSRVYYKSKYFRKDQ